MYVRERPCTDWLSFDELLKHMFKIYFQRISKDRNLLRMIVSKSCLFMKCDQITGCNRFRLQIFKPIDKPNFLDTYCLFTPDDICWIRSICVIGRTRKEILFFSSLTVLDMHERFYLRDFTEDTFDYT